MERNGYLAWEYYFEFGGGRPPWVSGMAQGTAMQALARAGERLADPALTQVGRRGLGAFEQRTPRGVRVPQANGDWYALYSFAPKLYVLNGHLQAVNGLRTHAELSGDAAVLRAVPGRGRGRPAADRELRHGGVVPLQPARPGSPGRRRTSTTTRSTATSRATCARAPATPPTAAPPMRSRRYLKEDPTLDPQRAVPSPAVGGKGVRFKFRLSKIGRVGIVVRAGGQHVPLHQRVVRARRSLHPLGPAAGCSSERTYEYTLYARDLAGNSSSSTGEVRVKAARPPVSAPPGVESRHR